MTIDINNNNYHKFFSFQFPLAIHCKMVKCNGVSAFQVLKYTLECSLCLAKNVMSMVWIGELTNFAIKKVVFKFPSPKYVS